MRCDGAVRRRIVEKRTLQRVLLAEGASRGGAIARLHDSERRMADRVAERDEGDGQERCLVGRIGLHRPFIGRAQNAS